MVAGVHNRSTHRWTATQVAGASRFTQLTVLVIGVADLSDGCHTENVNAPLLA
jgi:hypothetical protein